MFRLVFSGLLLVAIPGIAVSQNAGDNVEVERSRAAQELVELVARGTAVTMQPAHGEPVKLQWQETPLLRWSNPEAGSVHGAVYLWTDDSRPQFVASIFKWYSPHTFLDAEVHSLSAQPLVANRDGKPLWTTGTKSMAVVPLPGAPAPAETPAKRRAQMRAILREMSAEQTTRETQAVQPLRLLETPLYRYHSDRHQIVDGGLFSFVWATDPQIMVLLEATTGGTAPGWQAIFARQTACALRLKRNGDLIYQVEQLPWAEAFRESDLYNILRISEK